MKFYILILAIFLTYTLSFSASPDSTLYYNQLYQENLNWDWTDPNDYPDYFYISGKQPIPAVFPFTDANLGVVTEYADYEPEDGWVLLFKDFGSPQIPVTMPYMVLYNKYTGIMRVFVLIIAPRNRGGISLQAYFEENGSANLNFVTNPAVALDKFDSYREKTVIGFTKGPDGQWIYDDVPIAYDPNINNSESVTFRFDVKGINNNTIKIDGKTLLVQKSFVNLGQNNKPIFDIIDGAGKSFQEKYNSWTKIKNATVGTFDETANFLRNYGQVNIATALQGLSGLVSNLPFGSPGPLYGLYTFFAAGGKKIEPIPNVFEDNIQLTGTMGTQLLDGKIKIRVPGSIPPTYDYWKPVYDVPLGVTNLISTPILYKTTYFQLNGEKTTDVVLWNSYKLVSNIDPIINPNANLTLEDVKAELYFSYFYPYRIADSQYDLLQNWADDGYIDFKGGKLIVRENNENEVILTYSTGFLPLDSLKNFFINVPDIMFEKKIYLKLYYRFRRNDNQTAIPVVFVNTFEPDVINKESEVKGPWSFYLKGTVNGNKIDLKWSDLFKKSGETALQIQESIDGINWHIIYTKQNPVASYRTYSAIPNETGRYRFYRVLIKDNKGMNVYSQVDKVVNPNYQPTSVTITGPTTLHPGQTGTFTANVQEGTPPYQYAWYKYRPCGASYASCNIWQYIGSGQTVRTGDNLRFNLKVEVSDVSQQVLSADQFVEVDTAAGNAAVERKIALIPHQVVLSANYPNPFNPTTVIRFGLPQKEDVQLIIYSILGQKVTTLLNREMAAGYHQVEWAGKDGEGNPAASGVYIYELKTGGKRLVRKMLLVR